MAVGEGTGGPVSTPMMITVGDGSGSDSVQRIRLVGQVDVRSVGMLRTLLHAAIDSGRGPLHVDVGGLELGDHAGLGVLLGCVRRARALGRSLVLVDVPAALARLLAADRLGRWLWSEDPAESPRARHA